MPTTIEPERGLDAHEREELLIQAIARHFPGQEAAILAVYAHVRDGSAAQCDPYSPCNLTAE